MKIIIFGSTGTVGKQLVQQALDAEHEVTAFARDISKIILEHKRLTKVAGNVLDREAVDAVRTCNSGDINLILAA